MKKCGLILTVLILTVAFLLSGCLSQPEAEVESETPTAEPTIDGTPTPRVIPTYVPPDTPAPVIFSDSPHADILEYRSKDYAKLEIMQSQKIADIMVTVISFEFNDNYVFEHNEYVRIAKVSVQIENQGSDIIKVRPQDSILTLGTGETELVSEYNENEKVGELEPSKSIELTLIFRFHVTRLCEISSFSLHIYSPTDMNDDRLGEDYAFKAEFEFPDYEEISREDIIRRTYNYWHALISGFEGLGRIYPSQFIGKTGPITLHIPLASTVNFDSGGAVSEMVVLPVIAEFDSEEGFYYFLEHSAVILSSYDKGVECDVNMSTARQMYFKGTGFIMASLSYNVTGMGVEEEKFFGFSNEAPYTKDAVYLGEGIAAVLDIEEQN